METTRRHFAHDFDRELAARAPCVKETNQWLPTNNR
jgi:hypothetical protein